VAGLGLAYDNELGGRMWAGLVDRRFVGLALEASGALFLGELRREIALGFRRNYEVGGALVDPTLTVRLANESVRRFDSSGDELDEAETREAIGFAGVERAFSGGWEGGLGVVAHSWDEPGQDNRSTLGGMVRLTRTSRSRGRVAKLEATATGIYRRVALETELIARLGAVRVIPRVRLGWGEQVPLQLRFPLGGTDGFPGLHIGERRGDREAMLGIMLTMPVRGPLLARLEIAGGRTATGGPLLDSDRWEAGVRAGLGAETPVGPVRFEYGLATRGRDALFVRIGRWF
jgi:hypothetical protein